ncbi:hypothetical protein [Nocardia jiangxiensis]|uniref:hypothetical protein n=1 Tax=Nocardia jiangxiensis TaxID=282685 RepID=UPI0002ECB8D8|nr:hypothetical protein [Nocardia jiangxiensis]
MNKLTALGIAHELAINEKKIVCCLPDYWDSFDMVKSYLTSWPGGERDYLYKKLYGTAIIRRIGGRPSIHFMPAMHGVRGMQADVMYVEGDRSDDDKMVINLARAFGAEVIYA